MTPVVQHGAAPAFVAQVTIENMLSKAWPKQSHVCGVLEDAILGPTSWGYLYGTDINGYTVKGQFIEFKAVDMETVDGHDMVRGLNGRAFVIASYLTQVNVGSGSDFFRKHISCNPEYYASLVRNSPWGERH